MYENISDTVEAQSLSNYAILKKQELQEEEFLGSISGMCNISDTYCFYVLQLKRVFEKKI